MDISRLPPSSMRPFTVDALELMGVMPRRLYHTGDRNQEEMEGGSVRNAVSPAIRPALHQYCSVKKEPSKPYMKIGYLEKT